MTNTNPLRDAVINFLTAGGTNPPQEAAANLRANFERVVAVAVQMNWPFPGIRCNREEVAEVFMDFLEEYN